MKAIWKTHKLSFQNALRVVAVVIFAMLSLSQSSCGNNLFENLRPVGDDEALLFDAKQYMSDRQWTEAITAIESMSADGQAERSVQMELAKAYSGRCGMDFLSLIQTFTDDPATGIFKVLQTAFQGAGTSNSDDCLQAEAIVQAISVVPAERSSSENLTFAFIELAKIGSILAARGDVDADGVPDWAHEGACTVGNGTTDFLTNDEASHIATGFGQALQALTAVGGAVGGDIATNLADICTLMSSFPPPYDTLDFCTDTDIADIDANERTIIRSLVQEGMTLGLGTCTDNPPDLSSSTDNAPFPNCLCP